MLWAFYSNATEGEGPWAQNARNQVRIGRVITPLGAGIFAIGLLIAVASWIW